MNTENKIFQAKELYDLLLRKSKHSQYQELHPRLIDKLALNTAASKMESIRWDCMIKNFNFENKVVLDIGANTGFFSFAAVEANAKFVTAIEGNSEHADFISKAIQLLKMQNHMSVKNCYFTFDCNTSDSVDLIFCLNVLHHVGDDFDDKSFLIEQAKDRIRTYIQTLSLSAKYCWFQIGYNWRGNVDLPLFERGLKREMIDFILESCKKYWHIKKIAIFNPVSQRYEDVNEMLMTRFDEAGEFLNRPLFLLESFHEENK